MRGTTMTPEAARQADLADLKLGASTSFGEREVAALEQLFAKLRVGGDARMLIRSPELVNVQRKLAGMRASIERNRDRRAAKESV